MTSAAHCTPCRKSLRNIKLLALITPDKQDFTIVGMNQIEPSCKLEAELLGLYADITDFNVTLYITSRTNKCTKLDTIKIKDGKHYQITIPENCIFTLTTLD